MPWCPHCKKQQPPGSVCPDCGAPLLTVLHGSDANEPVLLTTISNEDQLELLTSLLHEENILFFTRDRESGEYMRLFMGFSVFGQEIYVRRADYERCVLLFRQLDDEEFEDEDTDEAYDEYMLENGPAEETAGNNGYRTLLGFFLFFAVFIAVLWLVSR